MLKYTRWMRPILDGWINQLSPPSSKNFFFLKQKQFFMIGYVIYSDVKTFAFFLVYDYYASESYT